MAAALATSGPGQPLAGKGAEGAGAAVGEGDGEGTGLGAQAGVAPGGEEGGEGGAVDAEGEGDEAGLGGRVQGQLLVAVGGADGLDLGVGGAVPAHAQQRPTWVLVDGGGGAAGRGPGDGHGFFSMLGRPSMGAGGAGFFRALAVDPGARRVGGRRSPRLDDLGDGGGVRRPAPFSLSHPPALRGSGCAVVVVSRGRRRGRPAGRVR